MTPVIERTDQRTKPVFYDVHTYLGTRPKYHRVNMDDLAKSDRLDGDVEITSTATFDIIGGRHVPRTPDVEMIDREVGNG